MNPTIVFQGPSEVALEMREIPRPVPHQLLIRTSRTLISTGTELTILNGKFPAESAWSSYGRFPFVPGYCNVGVVVEVGEGIDEKWIGRRVASRGNHAAYVAVSESSVFTLPDGVQDEQAVFLTIAQIVLNGVRRAGVQLGQSVAVYGLGLLGQLTVRFCRRCGARPVAAIDVAEPRIELLPKDSGIVHINARQCDVLSTLREVTGGQLCDIVFEVTGRADQLAAECKAVRRQGKFVILSSPSGASSFDFHDLCNAPSVTIIGAHVSSAPREESPDNPWSGRRNAQTFFNCLLDGELDLQRLISHRSPFTEAPQLYRSLLADRSTAMGVVIEWSKLPKGNAT